MKPKNICRKKQLDRNISYIEGLRIIIALLTLTCLIVVESIYAKLNPVLCSYIVTFAGMLQTIIATKLKRANYRQKSFSKRHLKLVTLLKKKSASKKKEQPDHTSTDAYPE